MLGRTIVLISVTTLIASNVTHADPFKHLKIPQFVPKSHVAPVPDILKALENTARKLPGSAQIIVQDGPKGGQGPTQAPPPATLSGSGVVKEVTPLEHAQQRAIEQFDPRVVGGIPANIGDFPWQVILVAGSTPEYVRSPFCGGSLIGYQWVVTAAHCMAGIADAKMLDVITGSTFPRYNGEGDRISVQQIIVHPDYKEKTFENDIALIKLSRPVRLGEPIQVPSPTLSVAPGSNATVSGWGAVVAYGPMTDRLLKADVPIVPNATCNEEAYKGDVKEGMLCAGYREGGVDACQGDSGGPLMAKVSSVPTLVGIVSWGRGCALKLKYGVYTRVTTYAGWIKTSTGIGSVADVRR